MPAVGVEDWRSNQTRHCSCKCGTIMLHFQGLMGKVGGEANSDNETRYCGGTHVGMKRTNKMTNALVGIYG